MHLNLEVLIAVEVLIVVHLVSPFGVRTVGRENLERPPWDCFSLLSSAPVLAQAVVVIVHEMSHLISLALSPPTVGCLAIVDSLLLNLDIHKDEAKSYLLAKS